MKLRTNDKILTPRPKRHIERERKKESLTLSAIRNVVLYRAPRMAHQNLHCLEGHKDETTRLLFFFLYSESLVVAAADSISICSAAAAAAVDVQWYRRR